jgi:hypothetical protein
MSQQQLESSLDEIARTAAVLFHEGRMPLSVTVSYSDGSSWQPGLGCESLRREEWEPVLARTLRSALERMHRGHRHPICLTISFSDHSYVQFGLAAGEWLEARGVDNLSHCKQDITRVLHDANERLTTKRILTELRVRNFTWGESTVKRALAEMVREHELNNRHDTRPRGYGLPGWH